MKQFAEGLKTKLDGADAAAQKFYDWKVTKNQLRALYGHVRTLSSLDDEAVLQVELKLFLARLMYKCKRQGLKLDEAVFTFFKTELRSGAIGRDEFRYVFLKYFEAVVAYAYGHLRN